MLETCNPRRALAIRRSGSDRVTLDAELGFVRDYLELEQLRLGERLRVEWHLDEDAGDHPLPALPRILREMAI